MTKVNILQIDNLKRWLGDRNVRKATLSEVEDAAGYQNDNFEPGDKGHCDPANLDWYVIESYPVSRLVDVPDANWLKEENTDHEGRFDDMLNGDIKSPIVVMDDGDRGYIWDGYHRSAAAVEAGKTTIPAIIGIRMSELTSLIDINGATDSSNSYCCDSLGADDRSPLRWWESSDDGLSL